MLLKKRLIERYIISATLPYFALALLLLTVVLLAQQATRFAEILGAARAPMSLAAEIALGLLPNILIFTLPMATLTGTATGFSRMSGDSELIAMRAAGVSTARVVAPMVLLGALISAATLYVGMEMAPDAAYALRQAGLRAALYRLDSPVEPRTFNTELPGKIVYVRDGDRQKGEWGRVFIYWQEKNRPTLVVTARTGRIDSSGEQAELVLSDAVVTTLPSDNDSEKAANSPHNKNLNSLQFTTERSSQLRIRDDKLNTGRKALLGRLRERELEPDEMNWRELRAQAASPDASPAERRAAEVALQKRLALCCAPLVLAFCGAGLGLRARRGGRGLGVLLSLSVMIAYYLISLVGDQMARTGTLPIALGTWLATGAVLLFGAWLLFMGDRKYFFPMILPVKETAQGGSPGTTEGKGSARQSALRPGFLGLLDRYMLRSLSWNFTLATLTLVIIFLIFTLFELLRFIAATGAGAWLVARYLLFLSPLAIAALAPMGMLVASLVAYALTARRSEAIAWWACGQSVYRLAVPGILFAAAVGVGLWGLQEKVLPEANRTQNGLRGQIRGGVARATTPVGRQWLATGGAERLYSYDYDEREGVLKNPVLYEFDGEGVHLRRIVAGGRGVWMQGGGGLELSDVAVLELGGGGLGGGVRRTASERIERAEPPEVFKPTLNKPAEMNFKQLSAYIKLLKKRGEIGDILPLLVALERKRADTFAPLVMALVGIPLALAFGRRSAIASLCGAVVIGLGFWGATSGFQQLGTYGLLPPTLAAWAPPVIFAAAGIYMLFRART